MQEREQQVKDIFEKIRKTIPAEIRKETARLKADPDEIPSREMWVEYERCKKTIPVVDSGIYDGFIRLISDELWI